MQRFFTKSSRNLTEKTPEAAHFSGKFAYWKFSNLLKRNTTKVTFQDLLDLMKLDMKFENSKNTFYPENPQIVAYINRNQIIITKVMSRKDHQKKVFFFPLRFTYEIYCYLPSYLFILNLFNAEIIHYGITSCTYIIMRYYNPNEVLDKYKAKLNIKIYKPISGAMHQSFASRF